MRELSIDIETYSSIDLNESGVYAYCGAPDFRILLFAYAFDDEEVQIADLENEELPEHVLNALTDKEFIKTAFNAEFEITCIQQHFGIELDVSQWRCTQVHAAELGLPRSLEKVATVLGLDAKKDKRGEKCIKFFSLPCKGLKDMPMIQGERHLPSDDPLLWKTFKEYCRQDVEVERAIKRRLHKFPIADSEQELWTLDRRISQRGCRIDRKLAENAMAFGTRSGTEALAEFTRLTGINKPKSVPQLKAWLTEQTGERYPSLNKKVVKNILAETKSPLVKQVLKLRSGLAKTSVKKYEVMLNCLCSDGRVRGFLKFYGGHTGRWSGELVQVHNLPQNHLDDLREARECVLEGDYEIFEMLYGNVPQTLSELVRTAFVPSDGCRFIVSDFSAIEARIIAYLANEKWRLDVFEENGDIYCASASQMFKVPVEKHGVNGHLRQKGKIAELALGYGGSVGALIDMGALDMGLSEEELKPLVDSWRESNPAIKTFWREVQKASINAVNGQPTTVKGFGFFKRGGILFVRLPSGRCIAYVKPQLTKDKFGRPTISYMGIDQKNKHWCRIETFGGKLVENLVQAYARDCLAESMKRLESRGYKIVFHVHDEVVIDAPVGFGSAEEVAAIMGEPLSWAKGLPLRAEGYETEFYRKD